jgi:prolipoprotein diacylglyceryl transferase
MEAKVVEFTAQGIQFGPIIVSFFSLIVLAALLSAVIFAHLRVSRAQQDTKIVIDVAVWVLVISIVLGRIFYVVNPPPSVAELYNRDWMFAHVFDLQIGPLAVWSGGIGSAGALLGGILGALIVLRRNKADLWYWGDLLTPPALLGLVISPFANLINQQMYGQATTLPWGIHVENPIPPYASGTIFHPTPVYVSLWGLLCLGLILWIERKLALQDGQLLLVAAVIYLPGLILADVLRVDVNHFRLGLTGMQTIAVIIVIGAGIILLFRRASTVNKSHSLAGNAVEASDR